MLSTTKRRQFPAGHVLFHEGSYGFEAYVIESGIVEVTRKSEGKNRIIGTYESNSLIGLLSILDGEPRRSTARALTKTSCTVLPDTSIKKKVDDAGDFISTIISLLVVRSRAGGSRVPAPLYVPVLQSSKSRGDGRFSLINSQITVLAKSMRHTRR